MYNTVIVTEKTNIHKLEVKKPEKVPEYTEVSEYGLVVDITEPLGLDKNEFQAQDTAWMLEDAGVYKGKEVGLIAVDEIESKLPSPQIQYAIAVGSDWRRRPITALVSDRGHKIVLKPGANDIENGQFTVFMDDDPESLMFVNGTGGFKTRVLAGETRKPSLVELNAAMSEK